MSGKRSVSHGHYKNRLLTRHKPGGHSRECEGTRFGERCRFLMKPVPGCTVSAEGWMLPMGNTTAEWLVVVASLYPFRRAIRWAVIGQEMSKRLINELKDISDGLYALLSPPYWKDVGRVVVEQLTFDR
jgi:hypothetical protein